MIHDRQLVALAEMLGWETTGLPPSVHNRKVRLPIRLSWEEWRHLSWLNTGDGADAVQRAMGDLGWRFWLRRYVLAYGAAFYRPGGDETAFEVEGDTMPRAIVLAAIAALEIGA